MRVAIRNRPVDWIYRGAQSGRVIQQVGPSPPEVNMMVRVGKAEIAPPRPLL